MFHPIILCFLFLASLVQSEVNQSSPAEQIIETSSLKDSLADLNDSRVNAVLKMGQEFENLTIDLVGAPDLNPNGNYFQQICAKNNKSEKYPEVVQAVKNLRKCFGDVVSYAELPAKIKKSKPYGELDTVFKEYCQKTDTIQSCVHYFLHDIDVCLDNNVELWGRYAVERMSETLLKFVCENEGDHIALFISEKGPDCILSKQEGIKKCVGDFYKPVDDAEFNEALELYANRTLNSSERHVQLATQLDLKNCRLLHKARKCIVNELTTCSGSTPANVVDSIFNLLHNESECSVWSMKDLDPDFSGGTSLFTSLFSVLIPALTVLLVRTFNS